MKVFAAEPRNADDCYQSKVRGELTPNLHPPDTIADAVKTSIGPNTWPIIRDLVDDVLTVSEEEIKVNTAGSLLTVAASRQPPPSVLCPSTLTPTLSQGSRSPCTPPQLCNTHTVSSWKGLAEALLSLPRALQRDVHTQVPSAALEQPVFAAGMTAAALSRQQATRLVWERMKLLIEPTAGVGVAAVLSEQFQAVPRDVENVCIVLCGGNVDLGSLTWLTDLPGKAE